MSVNDAMWRHMIKRGETSLDKGWTLRDPIDREKGNKKRPAPPGPMPDQKVKSGWQGEEKETLLAKGDWYPMDVRQTPRAYLTPPAGMRRKEIKSQTYMATQSAKRSHESMSKAPPTLSNPRNVTSAPVPNSHGSPSTSENVHLPDLTSLPADDPKFGKCIEIRHDLILMKTFYEYDSGAKVTKTILPEVQRPGNATSNRLPPKATSSKHADDRDVQPLAKRPRYGDTQAPSAAKPQNASDSMELDPKPVLTSVSSADQSMTDQETHAEAAPIEATHEEATPKEAAATPSQAADALPAQRTTGFMSMKEVKRVKPKLPSDSGSDNDQDSE